MLLGLLTIEEPYKKYDGEKMHLNKRKTLHAFTMIELILVIVVLGILASLALPRMERDLQQEAKTNIVSALRYTKNLALSDDKTNPSVDKWQRELWQLRFASYTVDGDTKWFYTISSDANHQGNVNQEETFIDPLNGKYMYHLAGDATLDETDESPNIFLSKKYGIDTIVFTGDQLCSGLQHIAFDNLGRPHSSLGSAKHDFRSYLKTNCTITIGFESTSIPDLIITIEAETGHITAI